MGLLSRIVVIPAVIGGNFNQISGQECLVRKYLLNVLLELVIELSNSSFFKTAISHSYYAFLPLLHFRDRLASDNSSFVIFHSL